MFVRAFKWVRFFILVVLIFNAFQGAMLRTGDSSVNPIDFVYSEKKVLESRDLDKGIEIDGSVSKKVKFFTKKSSDSNELITRSAILTIRPKAKATILICHGYMCSKFDVSFLRTFFPNYNCLIFDFRAHGENSSGQICTFGKDEALDVIGATNYIKQHPLLKNTKLFGYGFSMGAVSLIEAQAKKNLFSALILDCPFESTETVLDKGLESMHLRVFGYSINIPGKSLIKRLAFNQYTQPLIKIGLKMIGMDATKINTRFENLNHLKSIKKINVPCLFIHCKNDNRIPVKSIKRLFERVRGAKEMWLTNGRGHCDSFIFNPERYKKITNTFLTKFISGKLEKAENIIIDDA